MVKFVQAHSTIGEARAAGVRLCGGEEWMIHFSIIIFGGKNLAARSLLFNSSDPYCTIKLINKDGTDDYGSTWSTPIAKGTLNPSWKIVHKYSDFSASWSKIIILIYDKGLISDESMGQVEIDIDSLKYTMKRESDGLKYKPVSYPVMKQSKDKGRAVSGTLELYIEYLNSSLEDADAKINQKLRSDALRAEEEEAKTKKEAEIQSDIQVITTNLPAILRFSHPKEFVAAFSDNLNFDYLGVQTLYTAAGSFDFTSIFIDERMKKPAKKDFIFGVVGCSLNEKLIYTLRANSMFDDFVAWLSTASDEVFKEVAEHLYFTASTNFTFVEDNKPILKLWFHQTFGGEIGDKLIEQVQADMGPTLLDNDTLTQHALNLIPHAAKQSSAFAFLLSALSSQITRTAVERLTYFGSLEFSAAAEVRENKSWEEYGQFCFDTGKRELVFVKLVNMLHNEKDRNQSMDMMAVSDGNCITLSTAVADAIKKNHVQVAIIVATRFPGPIIPEAKEDVARYLLKRVGKDYRNERLNIGVTTPGCNRLHHFELEHEELIVTCYNNAKSLQTTFKAMTKSAEGFKAKFFDLWAYEQCDK